MREVKAREAVFKILRSAPDGMIAGRKKFQKIAHLLRASGEDVDLDFRIHHYGPFSDELANELYELAWNSEIEEDFQPVGPLGSHQYVYKLPRDSVVSPTLSETGRKLIENLDAHSTAVLEIASTIVYFRDSLGHNYPDAIEKTTELKPFAKRGSMVHKASCVIEKVDSIRDSR